MAHMPNVSAARSSCQHLLHLLARDCALAMLVHYVTAQCKSERAQEVGREGERERSCRIMMPCDQVVLYFCDCELPVLVSTMLPSMPQYNS